MEFKIELDIKDGLLLEKIINGAIHIAKSSGLPIDPNSYNSIDKLKELANLIICCSTNNQGEPIECRMM